MRDKKTRGVSISAFTAASVSLASVTTPVHAAPETQVAAVGEAAAGFEEIIVTARKREELLQSVPIAITALTSQDLERKGVQSLADLRYVAPSLSVQPDTFRQDTINVTIRGLRNYPSDGIQFDTAAAIYVNGVYLARTQGLTSALFDVDNVQVLKGPQGTLVGRNSTGGAVLYTTKEPGEDFGGSVSFTGGDYGRLEGQGIINVPITDKIFARAAMSWGQTDGYLRNIYFNPATGERNDTPGMGSRKLAGLYSLKIVPDDTTKILLRGDFSSEHYTGSSYHSIAAFEGTVLSVGRPSICNIPGTCNQFIDMNGRVIAPYYSNVATRTVNTDPRSYNAALNSLARQASDFWTIDQANSNYNQGHYQTVSGVVEKDIDGISFKVLGAYRWFDTESHAYSRGNPYNTLQIDGSVPKYESYTSELTVNGDAFENKLKWTGGFFFFSEDSASGNKTYLFSVNQPMPRPVVGSQITLTDTSLNSGKNSSYAWYAQGTYSILSDLRLTGGVRYTIDEREAHIATNSVRFPATQATTNTVANSVFDPGTYVLNGISYTGVTRSCALTDANGVLRPVNACFFDVARTFRKPTWTVSLDYDLFDKTLVYFTTRKGYRSGAINSGATNAAITVAQPENVQDYEIGVKSDWALFGMPVRTNLAGYFTKYRNIQTQVSLPYVVFAIGPNGGACTQTAFNAGQCQGTTTDNVTLNAKLAEIYGGEWDINIKPISQLTLGWNGSYLHAYYKDFSYTAPPGYLQPATGSNLNNTPFPLPAWTMGATATYTMTGAELGDLPIEDVSVTANMYWQGNYKTLLTGFNPAQKAMGYSLTNFRVAIRNIKDTNLDISGNVSNAFNKKACAAEPGGVSGGAGVLNSNPNATFGVPNTSGIVQCVPLPPRMFSITARYTF